MTSVALGDAATHICVYVTQVLSAHTDASSVRVRVSSSDPLSAGAAAAWSVLAAQ